MSHDDNNLFEKIRKILSDAMEELDPNDVAERMAAIHRGLAPRGVRTHLEGKAVRFTWGGRDLVVVEGALLADDSITADNLPEGEFLSPPDEVPPEWLDES